MARRTFGNILRIAVLVGAIAPLVAPARVAAGGIEIFGTSSSGGLDVAFVMPPAVVSHEFLLGTYSFANATTPLGVATTGSGIDATVTLKSGAATLAYNDDVNGAINRDAEIRSSGVSGRVGATIAPGLPAGSYLASFGRFGAVPLSANYAIESISPATVTAISKPGGAASVTISEVLINGFTLLLAGGSLDVPGIVTAESGAVVDVQAGVHALDVLQLKNFCELKLSGGLVQGSQLIVGTSGSPAQLTVSGGVAQQQVVKIGLFAGAVGNALQTGGEVHAALSFNIGNATSIPLSSYNLVGGLLDAATVNLNASGRMNLVGGELRVDNPTLILNPAGRFAWSSGKLAFRQPVQGTAALAAVFPAGPTLSTGMTLALDYDNPAFDVPVRIQGGALQVRQLAANAPVTLQSGRLEVTDPGGIVVAPGTYFGDHLTLQPQAAIAAVAATNQGLIDGNGSLAAPLNNAGEVRADVASTVRFDTHSPSTNAGRLTLNGGRIEFVGALTNAAAGDVTGRGALVADSLTNSGDIALSGGTSDVFAPLTNAAGGRVIVSGAANVAFWGDVINAAGGSIKVSSGSVAAFFGNYAGGGVSGGGAVDFEADVTPGFSPAAIDFAGNVRLEDSARLRMELAGLAPGSQYDQVRVAGQLSLGGTLQVSLLGGFTPSAGQSFDLLDWGSLGGAFSLLTLPTLGAGLAWNTSQLYSTGTLSVVSGFLAADFNENGAVSAADLAAWRTGFGTPAAATHLQGDANADGAVDGADLLTWQRQLGSSSATAATTAAPEPATLAVALCVIAARAMSRPSSRHEYQLSQGFAGD